MRYLHYGTVSVVLQAAPGTRVISGAVMLSDDAYEIDWEFSGNNFGQSRPTVQANYYGKGITGYWNRETQSQASGDVITNFFNYTLIWLPQSLTWMIKGQGVRTLMAADANTNDHQYQQTPARFYL
ncbi:glycoside hydrolase family 16 protein [Piedraia hortae CBS 480.64]|uniref:Glycoside hydrolase family 16 protein n=1 Tax=Piedraia hortae CBS 480.64 TaxID=1314780 RepID=A0A6A7BPY3_9PEZI|nr:glycoside hydrolase family 16 protein [Piedraia hortae CBS 480.64]